MWLSRGGGDETGLLVGRKVTWFIISILIIITLFVIVVVLRLLFQFCLMTMEWDGWWMVVVEWMDLILMP